MVENTQQVTFRLPSDLLTALDEAARFGTQTELGDPKTRAELVRRYLTAGLEEDGFWPQGHASGPQYSIYVQVSGEWRELASARPPLGARPEFAARVLAAALLEAAFYDGGIVDDNLKHIPVYELRLARDGRCLGYLLFQPLRRGIHWTYDVGALIGGMKATLSDALIEAFKAVFKLDTSPHRPNWTAKMPPVTSKKDLSEDFDEKRRG